MLQEPLDGQVVGYRAQESHAGSWGKVHLEVSLQQGGSQEPKVKSTPSTWDKSIRLLPGLQPSLGCDTLGTVDNSRYGIASSGFTRWPPWNEWTHIVTRCLVFGSSPHPKPMPLQASWYADGMA